MIHSLSGGVLADNSVERFVKVEVAGAPRWFISRFKVKEGDRVEVPIEGGSMEGRVLKIELCTKQTAPVSLSRAKEIIRALD